MIVCDFKLLCVCVCVCVCVHIYIYVCVCVCVCVCVFIPHKISACRKVFIKDRDGRLKCVLLVIFGVHTANLQTLEYACMLGWVALPSRVLTLSIIMALL